MLSFADGSFRRVLCLGGLAVMFVLGLWVSRAGAVVPGPAWSVQSIAGPTNFVPGNNFEAREESYRIFVTNVGSRPSNGSPVTITDILPPGITVGNDGQAKLFEAMGVSEDSSGGETGEICGDPCVYYGVVPPRDILKFQIPVEVPASAQEGSITNTVTVNGGGVAPASITAENAISTTPAPFAVKEFAFERQESRWGARDPVWSAPVRCQHVAQFYHRTSGRVRRILYSLAGCEGCRHGSAIGVRRERAGGPPLPAHRPATGAYCR